MAAPIKRSQIVKALCDVASQGTYNLKPKDARTMNQVFELAANLINELEAEERAPVKVQETLDAG